MPVTYLANQKTVFHERVVADEVPEPEDHDYQYAVIYTFSGNLFKLRYAKDPDAAVHAVTVDAPIELKQEATVHSILKRYMERYQEIQDERTFKPERGRRVRFVKPFRVHDFLDRKISRGDEGVVFWSGRSRLRKGGRWFGVALDDSDIRVYVDHEFIEGVNNPDDQEYDKEQAFYETLSDQESWEISWRDPDVFDMLHKDNGSASKILKKWDSERWFSRFFHGMEEWKGIPRK